MFFEEKYDYFSVGDKQIKNPSTTEELRGYKERTYDAVLICQLTCHLKASFMVQKQRMKCHKH